MTKRIQKLAMAVAALAALALGGAVFAQAQGPPSATPHHTSVADRDTVQSGDQTTPDKPAAHHASVADGDAVQSGDQTAPDKPGASTAEQTGSESTQSSESANNSDGPGGHADEPGNATADHQFQGNE
jgi:hypothetical protein